MVSLSLFRLGKKLLPGIGGAGNPPAESAVQLAIGRGDRARNARKWGIAASEYRAALAEESGLAHIWVQLGHAVKEQGDLLGAAEAYQTASRLQPDNFDTHIHLAHVFKQVGWLDHAITHFLHAFHFGLSDPREESELLNLLSQHSETQQHDRIESLLDGLEHLPRSNAEAPIIGKLRATLASVRLTAESGAFAGDAGEAAMVFDISDLIEFWRRSRLPTGIQRVQIEVIQGALARADGRMPRLCCFTQGRDTWLEVPVDIFARLASLATADGDREEPEWVDARAELDLLLSLTPPFVFPFGSQLINLGTSWWLQNYFLYVRHAKLTRGIRYIPFVHDMIPIIAPQHCIHGLTLDFISWALGAFDHADHYLVNSCATRRDLEAVAHTLGHEVDISDIEVVPLDCDFRKPTLAELPDTSLDKWGLKPEGFVLFVSTIESRKGHLHAFDAWARLIEDLGADNVPQLVCVGNRGWLNSQVYERLAVDAALSAKVTMLSGLSDAELALLYRSCQFTIYPSLYEGWGLPVTESLCYGKVPLISDAASLPEAGGSLAVYAKAGCSRELAEKAARLIMDAPYRAALEQTIRDEFKPRGWRDLASQIMNALDRFCGEDAQVGGDIAAKSELPDAHIGSWHTLRRNGSARIWPGMSAGEKYRAGLGWFWPDSRGCRIRTAGAQLAMHIAKPHEQLRLLIALMGDENEPCEYVISCGGERRTGMIQRNELVWVWVDIPGTSKPHDCTVEFSALPTSERRVPTYIVQGFFLCETSDGEARRDFLDAVTLGRLDLLDAFRER